MSMPGVGSKRRDRVWARDGHLCAYCGCRVVKREQWAKQPDTATIDHIIPRAVGGTHRSDNLVTACMSCNRAKGTMDADVFRMAIDTLSQIPDPATAPPAVSGASTSTRTLECPSSSVEAGMGERSNDGLGINIQQGAR